MKKCLTIIANPNDKSFCHQLAERFVNKVESDGNTNKTIDLCKDNIDDLSESNLESYRKDITDADTLVFVFPWWWEMPPYQLVKFLQTIFVKDFAYTHDGVNKSVIIDKRVILIITAGQNKYPNLINLYDAMKYCGLTVHQVVSAIGVNPSLTEHQVKEYFDWVESVAKSV